MYTKLNGKPEANKQFGDLGLRKTAPFKYLVKQLHSLSMRGFHSSGLE
jgi:hypothetical protein